MDYLQTQLAGMHFADWAKMFAFAIAAILTWHAARGASGIGASTDRRFWIVATVLMVCLGLNELFDLQTLFTATGRTLAREQGWYRERRQFQIWFMAIFSVCVLLGAVLLLWMLRSTRWPIRLALFGFVLIALFILLRAASFHHTDQLMRGGLAFFNVGTLLEMSGIVVVAIAALLFLRTSPTMR